ncbi:MAG: bifunctional metallophosphatase/5'-nucleotidase [Elusimicrobiota bacterium]
MGICAGSYGIFWNRSVSGLNFIFTSDGHGHILPSKAYWKKDNPDIGGLSAVDSYLKTVNPPYILTDSGDFFQGTPEGISTKGSLVVKLMNVLEYDALAVGNHDFDFGLEVLRDLSRSADFPFLCANVKEKDTKAIPAYFKDHIIKELNGVKIGVIGVITPNMDKLTIEENIKGLSFYSQKEDINKITKQIQEKGVKINILLSHLGVDKDKKIADELDDIDVILGGHTHKRLDPPIKVDRTIICQPGYNFVNIGHLKLYYSKIEDKLLSYSHKLVPLYKEKYPGTERIDNILKTDLKDVKEKMAQVIGESKVYMTNHLTGEAKKHGELAIGNWQTDLMRETLETDFAFQNTGGIRASIPKGEITLRDMWEISPFGNTLVEMTMTGKQIRKLLEQSAARKYSKLQVSGLKMVYNDSLPVGKRVLNIIVEDEEGQKKEIEDDREYLIVTNSFLAQGASGYTVFKQGTEVNETSIVLRDLEIKYIKENSPIYAEVEGRLINVSMEKTAENTSKK